MKDHNGFFEFKDQKTKLEMNSSRKKQNRTNRSENHSFKYHESRVEQKPSEFKPVILRKPENSKLKTKIHETEDKTKSQEVKRTELMTHSITIISHNHLETVSIYDFLDLENSSFYVVGIIGMKNSGKSLLLNMLATGEAHHCKMNLFRDSKKGNAVEAFITKDRVIFLDSTSVLNGLNCREFVLNESDDLRQVQTLFRMCNELLIVYENHQIMSLLRIIMCAKSMLNPYECNESVVTLVENRTRPGRAESPVTIIAKHLLTQNNVSGSVNTFSLPDINRAEDSIEIVHQLRYDINTRKEVKAFKRPFETEKSWWEQLGKMRMDGGHFIQEYESIRDKYYQPIENDFYV